MKLLVLLSMLSLMLAIPHANAGDEANTTEIGIRGGVDTDKKELDESYHAAELYLLQKLPWRITVGERAALASRFDVGAIYLEEGNDKGVMLAAGIDLVYACWNDRLELEAGLRPTWMFDHKYGDDDFGGGMQFTSHAGFAFNWRQMVLSYRFQHTSNAGIYDENPGLNLHMVGLGVRF